MKKLMMIALLISLALPALAQYTWDAERILRSIDIEDLQAELGFETNGRLTNVNGLSELFWDYGFTYFATIVSDTLIIVDTESKDDGDFAYAVSVILELLEIYLKEEVKQQPSDVNLSYLVYLSDIAVVESGGIEYDFKLLIRQADILKYMNSYNRKQVDVLQQSILPNASK